MTPTSSLSTRDTVLIALFAALIVVFSLMPPVPLAGVPVPITLQTFGVMLAAAMLGPWRGLLACALYTVLWAVGLPVLPGGRGGLGVLAGPTGGFLVGMIAGAWVTGWMAERLGGRAESRFAQWLGYALACVCGGIAIVYAVGIPWLAAITGMGLTKAAAASLVFVPGDLIKAGLVAVVVVQVRRAWPLGWR
ncbi:MAG: biotin transporter BioY [Pigmentiphaga sp.]